MPRIRLPQDSVVLTVEDVRTIAAVIALEVAAKLDSAAVEGDRDAGDHSQSYSSEHVRELIFEAADRKECTIPALAGKLCRACGNLPVIRAGYLMCPRCNFIAKNVGEWNEKFGLA